MTITTDELSQEQFSILYECERMKDQDKEPVVVSQRAVDAFREVHEEALRERGVSDPGSLTFEALAGQFTTLEKEEIEETVTALGKQMPATGGQPAEESEPTEASAEDRAEARDKLQRADKMEDRTPAYASQLRSEACETLSLEEEELEDIDLETL